MSAASQLEQPEWEPPGEDARAPLRSGEIQIVRDPFSGVELAAPSRATAYGKVILLGEHATVYGEPALVVGVHHATWAEASAGLRGPDRLTIANFGVRVTTDESHQIALAFRALVEATRADLGACAKDGAFVVEAGTRLPPGGGLGSSAALGVAIARAIDPHATEEEVLARAMAWERVFHGNPSGVDTEAAARGGCFRFQKGRPSQDVTSPRSFLLCVGYSGQGASTKATVARIAERVAARPTQTRAALARLGAFTELGCESLSRGDLKRLGLWMTEAQVELRALGVSTPELDRMTALAQDAGALGAKLTGGGGGGSVVALVDTRADARRVLSTWRLCGYSGFATTVRAYARPR
jgi:mevalonate kinase